MLPGSSIDAIVESEERLGSHRWEVEKLAQSSRRHGPVSITSDGKRLEGYVAYPDTHEKVPVVLMIPEDQGLNDWAKLMADEIAAMGYVVVVPDMLSGLGPHGGGRSSFPDIRSVIVAHSKLPAHEAAMTAQLNAWANYGERLPQANGKLAVAGFAWGGGRAFWFACQRADLSAAFIFYDAAPPPEQLAKLTAPVYGFYAAYDDRVTKSLAATKSTMMAAGKRYEQTAYPGSEHMFVRLGEEPRNVNAANIAARDQALARLQELLGQM